MGGCGAAKHGPLKPRFTLLAVRRVVALTAHFWAHRSTPAAVTGGQDRDDTSTVAVDAGAHRGRKWSPEPTNRHAVCKGVRIHVFEKSDPSEHVSFRSKQPFIRDTKYFSRYKYSSQKRPFKLPTLLWALRNYLVPTAISIVF